MSGPQWKQFAEEFLSCNGDDDCITSVFDKWQEIFNDQREQIFACDSLECLGYHYNQYLTSINVLDENNTASQNVNDLLENLGVEDIVMSNTLLGISTRQWEALFVARFEAIESANNQELLDWSSFGALSANLTRVINKNPVSSVLASNWNNANVLNKLSSLGGNYTVLVEASAAEAQIVTAGRVVSTVGGNVSNSTRALYRSSAITSPQLWGLSTSEWASLTTGSLVSYYSVVGMNNFAALIGIGGSQADQIKEVNSMSRFLDLHRSWLVLWVL